MSKIINMIENYAEMQRRTDALSGFYVKTPQIIEALNAITLLRYGGRRGENNDAYCGIVVGPTGTGKTKLFDEYMKRADAQRREDGTLPVIRVKVPDQFSIKALLARVLEALETKSFYEERGGHSVEQMVSRTKEWLARHRVELVLLDEFQHIIDHTHEKAKVPYSAADTIKALFLDDAKVPVMFHGIEVALEIFKRNKQLGTRLRIKKPLDPFDWEDPVSREHFLILLGAFEMKAQFPKLSGIADDIPLARRIHYATGGVIGEVKKLFDNAILIGTLNNAQAITQDLLAEAYAMSSEGERGFVNVFIGKAPPTRTEADETRVTKLHAREAV